MTDVLLVSKPVAPPWHDSSKNLVRDLAAHMQRYTPVVLSRRRQTPAALGLPRARVECIYSRAGSFSPALADNARVLARLLTGDKTALWHFFFAPNLRTSQVARWSARMRRARTLQTVCSAPAADAPLERVLFADHVVALSEHTRQRLVQRIAKERVSLIRPAVTALSPVTPERARQLRNELELPQHRPLVVYAGDLEFGRGIDLALEAHAALPETLDAQLIVACRAKTPRARQRERDLMARVAECGLRQRVRFVGETPRIHDLLAVADLVTLPTDTLYAKMDLPLVLIEAMSLARCVLVGAGTPAEELAAAGGAASVATESDAVSAMTQRLLEDSVQRSALGARARQVANTQFDPARMSADYEALYDTLCA